MSPDYISASKAVFRNFPYTAVLDCFRILWQNNTQKKKKIFQNRIAISKLLAKTSKSLCNSKDISMIAKEQESNERPVWALFKN